MVAAFSLCFALATAPSPAIDGGLWGTVLIVTQTSAGHASYGAGFVVDKSGLVVTNLHVLDDAQAVWALAYDPDKPPPAAVDGGLDRLMFERQADLIPVTVIRGDPVVDIAVVRLQKPARVTVLKLAAAAPSVGDDVLVVGHPLQSFGA